MTERKFKDGTKVRLRSGGPTMTIDSFGEYSGQDKYLCRWFDQQGKLQEDTFREDSLEEPVSPGDILGGGGGGPRPSKWG